MEGTYPLQFGGQTIGKVQVIREGLYYRFLCRCRLTGDIVCRVAADIGGRRENLGVLAPAGEGFSLNTRIPVKRFAEGKPEFRAVPNGMEKKVTFAPIYPEEPFSYIERLKDAYLARQNGVLGAVFREDNSP